MRQAIATAWALGLATLAVSQAPEPGVSIHDARPLLRAYRVFEPPHRLPLQAAFEIHEGSIDEGQLLGEDHLVEFLAKAANDPGTAIEVNGGQVLVKGPPAAHQAVAALMTRLANGLLRPVSVGVYAVGPGSEALAGVLTAAEAERALSQAPAPVELARTTALVGQPRRLRTGTELSFISDYEVEVAHGAAIADPVIRVLRQGLDLQAAVGETAEGKLLLRFTCARSSLAEPLAARAVGSTRLGDIQLPKVLSTVFAVSGLVEDGGALFVRHDGGLGTGTLVRVRRLPAPAGSAAPVDHEILFAGDLLGAPLRVPIPLVLDHQKEAREELSESFAELIEPSESAPLPAEVVSSLVAAALADDGETPFRIVGTRVHVEGPEAKASRVRAALGGLSANLVRNLTVEFRFGRTDSPTIPDDVEALAAGLTATASVPIALFDQFLVAAGLEQAVIIDHDVEIAQQAQIADPIVAPIFGGCVLSGIASAAGADRIELLLDLQHQEILPSPAGGFPSRAEHVGPIDLTQVDGTWGRHRLILQRGRWAVVAASNPGASRPFVFVVRVR